ncbi:MAG TPA: T9SS sorting signal type C domain-containing protein, partial [Flavobacterium sp.]|uniref:T9SS sorting signal type C domain-containing protein n=1 Tax=Flavobacterium sp. TaxID=239 RepID=UPI002B5EA256
NTGLITSNSAKVFNSSVPLTVANDSGGGLDNGGFAISGASVFTLANDANLYLSGTSTFPSGFSTNTIGATSTVEYNGTAQTVAVQNYGNLNLSNSGNKTFAGATLIADELALSGTAVAILPTGSTSFSQTLTFSGVLQASTSWGGTAATTATNNSAVWFGITSTGILNVSLACTIGTWLGQSSTDWNNPNNWCSLIIPAASTNVVIPAAAPYKPIISTAGGSCRNISIASGSSLTIDPSSTLTVSGNWVNNGTLYANGTTAFNGTVLQTISGTGSNVFNNLTNSKTTFPLNAARDIIVNGVLDNVNATSILDMGTNVLSGTFSNSGLGQIKTANTTATPIPSGKTWINTVVYNATTGGQSVVTGTYASLSLDNASGTQTALGNLTINNKLNIANGSPTFKMNGHDLSVGDFNITTSDAIIDMAGGSLSYTAITSMDGTISFSGATNGKAIPAGTVEYYGATQTVGPGTYNDITFTGTGGYSVNSDVVVNNELLITKGELTVQDGVSVTVSDIIKVDTPGTFILENNASLVQINDVTNVGRITYKRNTTPMNNFDYTYWSSPVSGQTLYNLSPNTLSDKYHSFTDPDWIDELGSNPMIAGKGYAIRTPKAGTWPNEEVVSFPYTQKVKFIGVPNNGDYTYIGISNNKSYLLGNPYPSAIDADAFLNENHLILDGTIYFWTHNTGIAPSGAFYVYNDNDYASYNLTGGTGTTAAATSISGVNFSVPSGKIAAGQSFFATGKGTGNVLFTNDMRVSGGVAGANNSQFFRTTKTKSKTSTAIEKNRVWLNLYNNEGAFKQTLVGYLAGATNGYDNRYDGESFDEHEFVDFYSVTPDKYLVIQGRALPFDETDTVPLGYRSKIVGNFNIAIDQTDGLLATQNVFIEDKLLNVVHNIKDTPYAFSTQAGTFDNRFVLRYTDKTLGNTDFEGVNSSVVISKDKNELKIKSEIETIKRVTVYDLLGKKVFEKEAVNSTEFRSSAIGFSQQIGIVKVTLDNGQVISKKVIF